MLSFGSPGSLARQMLLSCAAAAAPPAARARIDTIRLRIAFSQVRRKAPGRPGRACRPEGQDPPRPGRPGATGKSLPTGRPGPAAAGKAAGREGPGRPGPEAYGCHIARRGALQCGIHRARPGGAARSRGCSAAAGRVMIELSGDAVGAPRDEEDPDDIAAW